MAEPSTRLLHVLLVDDQEGDLLLVRSLLREIGGFGCELDWACTLGEAIAAFRQRGTHDVYLIDYRLGPCTGLDLRRELVARGCRAPMLILSACADPALERLALDGGAAACIDKRGLTPEALQLAIARALARGPDEAPAPPAGCRRRVLIIEDEPALRELWREVLDDAGWDVSDTATGESALQLLARRRVDVVLTDLHLPGLSGLPLVRALRASAPAVLAITGAEIDPEIAVLADAVLAKPVGLATIRAALARLLDRRGAATA